MNDKPTDAGEPRQSPTWPGETAADVLGPAAALDAQRRGREAALAGQDATTCPWRAATAGRDRAARDMWLRGYAAGRTDLRMSRPLTAGPDDGSEHTDTLNAPTTE
jgi:hypothetical protein